MRLLIFDAAKIISVFLIVLHHLPIGINERLGLYNVFIPVIGYPSIGSVGLIVFVITSGALLENKYGAGTYGLSRFYYKRFLKIYPAYWASLIFGLITNPGLLAFLSPVFVIVNLFALTHYTGMYSTALNSLGWFVGMIAILYLLFPFLSKIMGAWYIALVVVFAGLLVRQALIPLQIIGGIDCQLYILDNMPLLSYYFSPLGNIGFFCLGIFMMKNQMFPQIKSGELAASMGNYTYYVLLAHVPALVFKNNILVFLTATVLFAYLLKRFDDILKHFS